MFLTPTPLHGDVQHAAVGKTHVITLRAQSSGSRSEIYAKLQIKHTKYPSQTQK